MNTSPRPVDGVALALLEAGLLNDSLQRSAFLGQALRAGLTASSAAIAIAVGKFLAIAANQAERRASLRART